MDQQQIQVDNMYVSVCHFVDIFCCMTIYLYGLDRLSLMFPNHDLLFHQDNLYNWALCMTVPPLLYSKILHIQMIVDQDRIRQAEMAYKRLRLADPEYFQVHPDLVLREPLNVSLMDSTSIPYRQAIVSLQQMRESVNPI